jgi:hypothetical protein
MVWVSIKPWGLSGCGGLIRRLGSQAFGRLNLKGHSMTGELFFEIARVIGFAIP